ncbi:TonB C-terminal domain-containing protein, partial [Oleiphilus sp. HI0132]
SEQESEELRMVNKFLERMNKQVNEKWNNPYKGRQMHRGVAKLELDEYGNVVDVFIFLQSGLPALDDSVVRAIRAVKRFDVPKNTIIAERYSHLRFHFSSIELERDKMPFEVDQSHIKDESD